MAGGDELRLALHARHAAGVRVVAAPCIGACHAAPAACIGQHEMGHATAERVMAAAVAHDAAPRPLPQAGASAAYRAARRLRAARGLPPTSSARARRCWPRSKPPGCAASAAPASRPRASGSSVLREPAPRHLVVNIDEGEPGTFKDRDCLEKDPHRMLEGMLVAAWAVGRRHAGSTCATSTRICAALLEQEIAALLADPPVAGLPAIHLRRGAGAYICGEETALMESLEGRRG